MDHEFETLERKLLREIAAINKNIKALEQEAHALERLLIRSRRNNAAVQEAVRISSGRRILLEQTILAHLQSLNGRSTTTHELKNITRAIDYRINDNTFRSHLHRLKQKGKIESAGYGRWKMIQPGIPGEFQGQKTN
jgi:hypothetical protein